MAHRSAPWQGPALSVPAAALLLAAVACGPARSPGPRADAAAQLPAVGGLDALRGASAQAAVDVTTPLLEYGTSPLGGNLAFAPPAGAFAVAIYRIDPPVDTVVSIAAAGSDGMYVLLADFASGHWSAPSQLEAGFTVVPLGSLGQPLSADSFIYCAVLAPDPVQGQLTSLSLNYDGPANIYYVETPENGGDDLNEGSAEAPWATLQHAADTVGPDTLVIVGSGSFTPFNMSTSGTADGPIYFVAGAPDTEIRPAHPAFGGIVLGDDAEGIRYIVIEGFFIHALEGAGVRITSSATAKSDHISLLRNEIAGCSHYAIDALRTDYLRVEGNTCYDFLVYSAISVGDNSDHCIIRDNICYDFEIQGIVMPGNSVAGTQSDDALIEGNICYSETLVGGAGIAAVGLQGSVIRNNLLFGNDAGFGIVTAAGEPASSGNLIAHNTIVQGAGLGDCIILIGSPGNAVFNNVLLSADGHVLNVDAQSLADLSCDNNVVSDSFLENGAARSLAQWRVSTALDGSSELSLPALEFVNADTPDHHLLPSSAALNLALPAHSPPFDLDGVTRPQGSGPDCGCYEYTL